MPWPARHDGRARTGGAPVAAALCGDARAVGVRQDDRGDCGGVEQGGRGGPRGCCRCAGARRHAARKRAARRLTARTASPPAPLPRAQEPDADENKLLPIIAIGGGGTLLSTVFFAENLKRLGTKVASGGKDDGYTKSSNQRRR